MYNIFVSSLLSIIIIASAMASNAKSLEMLTPVEDPFEYQNDYYPLTVGNYWKMGHYKEIVRGKLTLVGNYIINVLDYSFEEIYFGEELQYLPIFRIEKQYIPLDSSETSITYQYAIKTEEGVIVSNEKPKDNKIEPYFFIPSGESKDELSVKLTNKPIGRETEVTTPFYKIKGIRIEITEDNIGGTILFAKNKGHVVSLLYDNYPQNSTRIDNQLILGELLIK